MKILLVVLLILIIVLIILNLIIFLWCKYLQRKILNRIQEQDNFYVPYIQYLTDSQVFLLLGLRAYFSEIIPSYVRRDDFESANYCKELMTQIDKLVEIANNRNNKSK